MNLEKLRGSLAKVTGQTGKFRSDLLDRDLRAQGCLDRDLISSVGLRSNGSDLTGRRGGGDLSPASYSAVACGGESLEYAVSGPPGVLSTRPWFGHGQRVTRDPPGAWVGLGKVHGGVCTGDSGSARRRSPERECSGHWNSLRDKILAQNVEGTRVVLT